MSYRMRTFVSDVNVRYKGRSTSKREPAETMSEHHIRLNLAMRDTSIED